MMATNQSMSNFWSQGGGWCNDIESCLDRAKTRRGSTRLMSKWEVFSGILSNNASLNPGTTTCYSSIQWLSLSVSSLSSGPCHTSTWYVQGSSYYYCFHYFGLVWLTELQLRKIPHFLPSNHLVIFTVDSKNKNKNYFLLSLFLKNPQYAPVYKFNAKLKNQIMVARLIFIKTHLTNCCLKWDNVLWNNFF